MLTCLPQQLVRCPVDFLRCFFVFLLFWGRGDRRFNNGPWENDKVDAVVLRGWALAGIRALVDPGGDRGPGLPSQVLPVMRWIQGS